MRYFYLIKQWFYSNYIIFLKLMLQKPSKSFSQINTENPENFSENYLSKTRQAEPSQSNIPNQSLFSKSAERFNFSISPKNKSTASQVKSQRLISDTSLNNTLQTINWDEDYPKANALSSFFQDRIENGYYHSKLNTNVPEFQTVKSLLSHKPTIDFDDSELARGYIRIREWTEFEEIDEKFDNFPMLEFRKAVLRIRCAFVQLCNKIVTNPIFDILILCFIFMNTVVLALEDPNKSAQSPSLEILEDIFFYVYTTEFALKVIAFGFIFCKNAYLRDAWNVLDFFILLTVYISKFYSNQGLNFNALRSLRVLRPLKSISSLKGLKVLVLALLGSIVPLANILIILFFVLLLYAIIGYQLFGGLFKYQCMDLETGKYSESFIDGYSVCGTMACPSGNVCVQTLANPEFGFTNFDNVLIGVLQSFTIVNQEGWAEIMEYGERTLNQFAAILYSVSLMFFGNFLLLNMMEVILFSNFSKEMEKVRLKHKLKDIKEDESANLSLLNYLISQSDSFEDAEASEKYEKHISNNENSSLQYENHECKLISKNSDNTDEKFVKLNKIGLKMHDIFKKAEIASRNRNTSEMYELIDSSENLFESSPIFNKYEITDSLGSMTLSMSKFRQKQDSALIIQENKSFDLVDQSSLSLNIEEDFLIKSRTKNDTISIQDINIDTKEKLAKKASLISRITTVFSSNLKRSGTKSSSDKLPQVVTRIKNLKIQKDLIGKLKKLSEHTKVKAFLEENNEISSSSIEDVLQDFIIENEFDKMPKLPTYKFVYRGSQSIYTNIEKLTQKWENEIANFLNKYKHKGDFSDIFKYLCKKQSKSKAFYKMTIDVPKIIKFLKQNDLDKNNVIGDWSGYDIDINSEANEYREKIDSMAFMIWTPGFMGNWEKFKYPLLVFIKSKFFIYFMIICIIFNTTVLSINYYGIDENLDNTLSEINSMFTIIFIAEMAIKIIAMGLVGYCREKMNLFDGAISILAFIEFIYISGSKSAFSAIWAIRVFRIFRVTRVVKLFRYMETMNHIMDKLSHNVSMFFYIIIFQGLFLIIFTILGVQLFAGKMEFYEAHIGYNFNDLYFSFLSIFQIMTGANWNYQELYSMRTDYSYSGVLFPVIWLIVGHEILLSIALALVLDIFSNEDNDFNSEANSTRLSHKTSISSQKQKIRQKIQPSIKKNFEENENDEAGKSLEDLKNSSINRKSMIYFAEIECSRSFWIFSKENKLRKFCYRLSNHHAFEVCALIVIALSTAKLIWDTYLFDVDPNNIKITISNNLDIAFTCIFGLEMAIKSISMGFVISKGSYLRNHWCQLDFAIVILSITDLALTDFSWPMIKVLRLLRILRPLRIITHNVQMKIMINALIESLIGVLNVASAILILWLIFSILGVSLFAGKLYFCSFSWIFTQEKCEEMGYTWDLYFFNFDNVFEAMVASFILTSEDDWSDYMYLTCATTKPGHALYPNNNPNAAYYFVIHMCMCSIFFINLLIGVVFEKFIEAKQHESSLGSLLLTKEQMIWVEIQSLITQSKPEIDTINKPQNKIRLIFYKFQSNWIFEAFIITCIILNFILMCLYYDQAPQKYQDFLELFNMSFTFIFISEAAIKIIALGKSYFKDRWNRFDFFVVIVSILDFFLSGMIPQEGSVLATVPQLVRALRVLRVTKIIRLIKKFKTMQDLITLLSYSIPSILNVSAILLLIFVIYAILGVYLFHSIDNGTNFDSYNNMNNFDKALLKLFIHATGEGWAMSMDDCAKSSAGKAVSYIYWISFISLTTFIMLNLFVMVILQDYEDFTNDAQSGVIMFNKDVKKFKKVWATYTESTQGKKIHYKFLVDFMYALGNDLGVSDQYTYGKVIKLLLIMQIDIDFEGFVYYNDMLFAVMKRKYSKFLKRDIDIDSQKLLRKEELKTSKKLQKLKQKTNSTENKGKLTQKDQNNGKQKNNLIMSMIYARTVFRSWANWIKRRKNKNYGSISVTPQFSEIEFPGENSVASEDQINT
ncbi:unnamed protein product [Blepharisma stoltei]|uniref:Ion transport domain-containing protein n=1 Tax=Blepharisma stoltei TaxID=1481888 RepID=A0AAU9K928_9CILI|nr:unnamed protein product [Blepharisma stoltei]